MARKIRILSLDGGGIRGILPGIILTALEERLQERAGREARLADFFDLIAGTSTGGILACGYLVPDRATGRPRYRSEEMLDFYIKHGAEVFEASMVQSVIGVGLWDEKYDAAPLERQLERLFGDARLSEFVKPCLIPAYDIARRRAVFFDSISAAGGLERNYAVKDVARATSAAPTYFETSLVQSELEAQYPLIDGGVFANNPAMCAYAEARKTDFAEVFGEQEAPTHPQAEHMLMLSIGTGRSTRTYPFAEAKDWGVVGWIQPILDIMMSGVAETVDYQLKLMFETVGDPGAYTRWQPDLLDASSDMDDTSRENIIALQQAGLHFVADNGDDLDRVADRLVAAGPAA